MADIRRKFAEFDTDGSGEVTASEAHQILEKELAFTPQQSAELVSRYDKNGDGQLSFEEFVRFYSKVQAKYVPCYTVFVYIYINLCLWECVFVYVCLFVNVCALILRVCACVRVCA